MSTPLILLQDVITLIQDQLRLITELRRRVYYSKLDVFATNLALVALGIRAGYLLDIFTFEKPVDLSNKILSALRACTTTKEYFSEPTGFSTASEEFFIQHHIRETVWRSRDRRSALLNSIFELLIETTELKKLRVVPEPILQCCSYLQEYLSAAPVPLSISFPEDMSTTVAVPVAGVLLDYLVAYVPESAEAAPLSNISLDFYEVIIISKGHTPPSRTGTKGTTDTFRHSIMKFSCTSSLSGMEDLQPQTIIDRLQTLFEGRLKESNVHGSIEIVHSTALVPHLSF
ncbi:hypothetical protein CVT24_010676 [Panaeolus cyanescens]|uniref:Uncharacterized protein n=1 Tax=Panaeolus cyanescens TaxID=181874 RepID=A0A409YLY9_9AGAR|nr:hypothetical protein CVT24_010676 [Panaeolus cyanescens]